MSGEINEKYDVSRLRLRIVKPTHVLSKFGLLSRESIRCKTIGSVVAWTGLILWRLWT